MPGGVQGDEAPAGVVVPQRKAVLGPDHLVLAAEEVQRRGVEGSRSVGLRRGRLRVARAEALQDLLVRAAQARKDESLETQRCACTCVQLPYGFWEMLDRLNPYGDKSGIWLRVLTFDEKAPPLPEGATLIDSRRVTDQVA